MKPSSDGFARLEEAAGIESSVATSCVIRIQRHMYETWLAKDTRD